MLCSRCSEPVRPIVALDIDGTLGDYHKHFIRFALGYLGEDQFQADSITQKYDGTSAMGTWFCMQFGVDIRVYRDIKLAYRQGGQKRNMPCHPWASTLTHDLMERAEIWLTTTRPYLRLDGVDPDTRFWLHHNSIYYDHLLYHEEKYTVLARYVTPQRVVAVVDDLPEDLASASNNFGPEVCILYRAPHNKYAWPAFGHDHVAHDGQVIKGLVNRRIDDWHEGNGSPAVPAEAGSEAQAT